jgi:hypothetical protein
MLQIQGFEGEAVVTDREPSITKEMRGILGFPDLPCRSFSEGRRVKKHDKFIGSLQSTLAQFLKQLLITETCCDYCF